MIIGIEFLNILYWYVNFLNGNDIMLYFCDIIIIY